MAGVVAFMETPLVTWVKTFNESADDIDFEDITDGVFLNDVFLQIEQRAVEEIHRDPKDANARIQNWTLLLNNIRTFYQDVLQQTIVLECPQILSIVKEPTKESSLRELSKLLLLLLGCAVQCLNKEVYINRIKDLLDLPTQQAIVKHIQQITEHGDHVIPMVDQGRGEDEDDEEEDRKSVYSVLRAVTLERDNYAQNVLQLCQERDYYKAECETKRGVLTPPPGLEQHHLLRQLNEANNRLNTLMHENEDRSRSLGDTKDELDNVKQELYKLRTENLCLTKDAKTARGYRDEIDAYKEKAMKIEASEKEIKRLKEKLNEMEFYKTRVDELRSDVSTSTEQRDKLEEQLSIQQKRSAGLLEELMTLQTQLDTANKDKDSVHRKLEELVEEHAGLQFEVSKLKEGFGSSGRMRKMMSYASSDSLTGSQLLLGGHPISEELEDCMDSSMARLEMEKEELQHDLEDTKQRLTDAQRELDALKKNTNRASQERVTEVQQQTQLKIFEMERTNSEAQKKKMKELTTEYEVKMQKVRTECDRLKREVVQEREKKVSMLQKEKLNLMEQIENLQEQWRKEKENYQQLEKLNKDLISEKYQFKTTIEAIRMNSESCIKELEKEVQALQVKADNPEKPANVLCTACRREVNQEGVNSVMAAIEREYPQLIVQQENYPALNRSRPSSGRYRHSVEREDVTNSVSRSMHSLPVQVSYVDGPPTNVVTPVRREMSRSSMAVNGDILRPHNGHRSQPRPASVMGVSGERSKHPIRGIVTPQRRAAELESPTGFIRGDKLRSTTLGRNANRPVSAEAFARFDRKRMTMPEKRSGIKYPDKTSTPNAQTSGTNTRSHTLISNDTMYFQKAFISEHGAPISTTTPTRLFHGNKQHHDANITRVSTQNGERTRNSGYQSDRDSGCATSPDSPESGEANNNTESMLAGLGAVSSETLRNSFKTLAANGKAGEKWKVFVDKIVELQDKNQQLTVENSEMRKKHNSVKFAEDRIEHIEKKNLELELENKKLRKIVEALQSQLSGGNPYDPREYHFYTNV